MGRGQRTCGDSRGAVVGRGDVCWLELAEEGRRPVCVLTRQEAIAALRNVVVAMVSRTIRDIPTEVRLDERDGMPVECAVSLDDLRTVPHALLTEPITRLPGQRMHEVCRALGVATGCS
jgi:mRNA interferase MazF